MSLSFLESKFIYLHVVTKCLRPELISRWWEETILMIGCLNFCPLTSLALAYNDTLAGIIRGELYSCLIDMMRFPVEN